MIRGVVIDLASRAIAVNNVQPGPAAADMTVGHAEILIPLIPLGRMGEPERLAVCC
jgi:3-oxoacyl-[acyl-carrier protein] reductase